MKINAIAGALPNWAVDSLTIESWCGLPWSTLTTKIGVERRRFLTSHETGTDLSETAVLKLAAENPSFDLARIGLLIVVTQNPDFRLPHNSALLQHRLGLPQTTACFDVGLGCSGYVYALSIAKGFMLTEGINEALIVTCDPYSKCMSRADRDVVGLFGDAATATWLCADGRGAIGRGNFGTDGGSASSLIVRAGGSNCPTVNLDGAAVTNPVEADRLLHMNGRAIFNFVMARIPEVVDTCLNLNSLRREDIDFFVFHQASRYLLETLQERMCLPSGRVPIVISETGNTVSSSIPLALIDLFSGGRLATGTVLLCGFGVGLSWAANVIQFREGL